MLKVVASCAALVVAACAVIPLSSPYITEGLDASVTEISKIGAEAASRASKTGATPLPFQGYESRYQAIRAQLMAAHARADARVGLQKQRSINRRAAENVAQQIGNCEGAVDTVEQIHRGTGLSATSFEDSLVLQTCSIAAESESMLRSAP